MLYELYLAADSLAALPFTDTMNEGGFDPTKRRREMISTIAAHKANMQDVITSGDQRETDSALDALEIRGKGACKLRVPQDQNDELTVLRTTEEQTGGNL